MREIHYDEARVPDYVLPDPLRFADGGPVQTTEAWHRRRREIRSLFEDHVYGLTPSFAPTLTADVLEEDRGALDGRALRRQVRIGISNGGNAVGLDLLLYLPLWSAPDRRAPVFLGLNFGGNHTVADDGAIALPRSWVRQSDTTDGHRATDAGRGRAAEAWSVERVIARGYGLATVHYGDIEPDHPDGFADSARGVLHPDPPPRPEGAWGALGAWAWGLSRVYDYLCTEAGIDSAAVTVMGHSRLGKTALWAGAQDERFAMVISNDSGCGGAALSRREFGETVARINTSFPHWFCGDFKRYNDREPDLPVDQHMLLALVAPRPVYVASAEDDRWADPRGEFLSALAADPVYRLLGTDGLGVAQMPPVGHSVQSTIGYHIRSGGHAVTAYDWDRFLDFADRHLPASTRS